MVDWSVRPLDHSTGRLVDWSVRPHLRWLGQSCDIPTILIGCRRAFSLPTAIFQRMFVTSPPPYLSARPRASVSILHALHFMSGEPLTRRERRERRALLIESEGREMPSPCSSCRSAKVPEGQARPRCIVDVRFGCCSQCVRKGYAGCDVTVTWTEWERLRNQRRELKRKLDEAEEKVTDAMSRVHRLRKQLRVAENREEKAIGKEFAALQELPLDGPGALEAPAECLLEPEGTSEELEGVFQLPIPSWADFSIVHDDAFWSLPCEPSSNGVGGIALEVAENS